MPPLIVFADLADRATMLDVTCHKCPRKGRYRLDKLIARYGRDEPIRTLLVELTAACPRRLDPGATGWDTCQAHFPGVPMLLSQPGRPNRS